jgi:vanillate O-demethylase monooxygenase subunit
MFLDNLDPAFASQWMPVAASDEITTVPHQVSLRGRQWVLWRNADGAVHALIDECPHRGASLSVGHCDGQTLQCGYHGWRFDPDGTCVEVPSMRTGWSVPPRFATTGPAGIDERYGLVWLAEEEPTAPIPAFGDWDAEGFVCFALDPMEWRTSAAQMADNFLDLTHFPFLHSLSFADPEPVEVIGPDCVPTATGFHYDFHDNGDMGERRTEGEFESVHYEVDFALPYWVDSVICYDASKVRQAIVTVMQPQTVDSTRLYTLMARNDIADDPESIAAAKKFQEQVADEDRFILEHTPAIGLELDLRRKRSSPSDRVSVEFHRCLAAAVGANSSDDPLSEPAEPTPHPHGATT